VQDSTQAALTGMDLAESCDQTWALPLRTEATAISAPKHTGWRFPRVQSAGSELPRRSILTGTGAVEPSVAWGQYAKRCLGATFIWLLSRVRIEMGIDGLARKHWVSLCDVMG
jgi:hypothetical protein